MLLRRQVLGRQLAGNGQSGAGFPAARQVLAKRPRQLVSAPALMEKKNPSRYCDRGSTPGD